MSTLWVIIIRFSGENVVSHENFYRECFIGRKKERSYTLYAINNTELFLMPHQMQRKDE